MQSNFFNRIFSVSLFSFLGMVVAVMFVNAMDSSNTQYIFAGIVLFVVVFIVAVRIYFANKKKKEIAKSEGKDGSQVEFVVDTFHDLVSKLKDKENELERLRSSAEERASRIEAYNENILQSVPSGVVTIDNTMNIKSVNQAAERILGINHENVIEMNFRETFNAPLTSLANDARPVSRGEYSYFTTDGRNIWLGITVSELKNSAGDKIGLIFIFTDLTDIKSLQSRLELKQRLSQLGEMSAGISHELRNSMSVISGYAKLLSKKVDPSCTGTVNSIITEINGMNRIISELLAFTRPSVLSTEEINLGDLLMDVSASALKDNDNIKFLRDIDDTITVKADKVLLKQAFLNLFINAVEAMPDGGLLEVKSRSMADKVILSIKDSGSGIPDNIRQKVFLPFYTTKQTGTGFGLALVQKIILSHLGSIEIGSMKGEGTVFNIMLPSIESVEPGGERD